MGKAIIPTDAEVEAIRRQSEIENAREIRAAAVEFEPTRRTLRLTLAPRNDAMGAIVVVPIEVSPALTALNREQLAAVRTNPSGTALIVEAADLYLSVEALVLRALMGPDYHERLRKVGAAAMGRATSTAKAEAVRENGKRGGRPRKQPAAET